MGSFSGEIRIKERFWFLDTSDNTLTTKALASRAGDYPYYESPDDVLPIDDYDADGAFVVVESAGRIADSFGRLRARFVEGRASFSSHCLVLTASDSADVRFLYRILSNERAGLGTGSVTGTATLTRAMLGAHRIPWPPKQLRDSFCAILDDLDAHRQLSGKLHTALSCVMRKHASEWFRVSSHAASRAAAQETRSPEKCDLPTGKSGGQSNRRIAELCTLVQGCPLKHQDFSPTGSYPVYSSRGEIGKTDNACTGAPTIVLGFLGNRPALHWCDSPVFVTSDAWYVDRVSSPLDMATLYCVLLLSLDGFKRESHGTTFGSDGSAALIAKLADAVVQMPSSEPLEGFSALATALLKQKRLLEKSRNHAERIRRALVRTMICKPCWRSNEDPGACEALSENAHARLRAAHDARCANRNEDRFATCADFAHRLLEYLGDCESKLDQLLIGNPHPHGFEAMRLFGPQRSYCLICGDNAQADAVRSFLETQEPFSHKVDLPAFFGLEADPISDMKFDQAFCDVAEGYEGLWSSKTVNVDDPRWVFGVPARNKSDYAWIQQTVAHLAAGGTAVVMVPNISLHIDEGRNKTARIMLAKSGLLEAVIAFPGKLKGWHSLPASCLILRIPERGIYEDAATSGSVVADDAAAGTHGEGANNGQSAILFMDARDLVEDGGDGKRILPYSEMEGIVTSYERWIESGKPAQDEWADERSSCRAATPAELEANGFDLRPWIYMSKKDGSEQLDEGESRSSQPRETRTGAVLSCADKAQLPLSLLR